MIACLLLQFALKSVKFYVLNGILTLMKICVFCGSSHGTGQEYRDAAENLARIFLEREIGLIYLGARVGLMATIASAIHRQNGEIIGVIPETLLKKEIAYTDLSDLRIVHTMHERKALMFKLADGFIALPGGLGTIEELFEVLTWAQLGMHSKPCGILNINGYFNNLVKFLEHAINENFMDLECLKMVLIDKNPERLIKKMTIYEPPKVDKARRALEKLNILSNR